MEIIDKINPFVIVENNDKFRVFYRAENGDTKPTNVVSIRKDASRTKLTVATRTTQFVPDSPSGWKEMHERQNKKGGVIVIDRQRVIV